jgi:hypothetical protein
VCVCVCVCVYPRNFTRISELGHRVEGEFNNVDVKGKSKNNLCFLLYVYFFLCFLFSVFFGTKIFFFFFSFTFRKKSLIKFFPYFD